MELMESMQLMPPKVDIEVSPEEGVPKEHLKLMEQLPESNGLIVMDLFFTKIQVLLLKGQLTAASELLI